MVEVCREQAAGALKYLSNPIKGSSLVAQWQEIQRARCQNGFAALDTKMAP
jgi:hypothetical protein